ncbi:MAG TPA: UDP-N-acetylmuramoyl-tripeptide--D-alanyl-D-alanine ligase [Actinomycetales bacterium]|nr:UDP-N-acetylmuramoyl-tripeptide--D-alanyl-D-alanine ligase [Actinomycetales bacterium]
MIPTTLADIAAATGGRLASGADPAAVVTADPVVDSRLAGPGSLFVAVRGEHVDGHDFAGAAVQSGAVAVLAEREVDVPCLVVDSSVAALGRLAHHVLGRLPELAVVGVTGSSGKTSTKDLMAAVLSAVGSSGDSTQESTIAAEGSFNNELGVPLTTLRSTERTRFLVLEMGARGIGHIATLCAIAPPRVGVVLNVGAAHAGEFGGLDAVEQAKGELVEAVPDADSGGVAVLNADDARVARMGSRTHGRVVLVGTSGAADVRATGIEVDGSGRARFTLTSSLAGAEGSADVSLQLVGEHHVANALSAAAVGLVLGGDVATVAGALSQARAASRWRMEVTERPDGITVVNDAYNANPDSVRAALKALAAMGRPSAEHPEGRRTWAVLGEMLELGDETLARHDEIGRLAVRLNISRLVAVGEGARPVHTGAYQEGSWGDESAWVADTDEAFALLEEELAPGDVVLVKSSNAIGLRFLGERLAAAGVNAG